MKDRSKNSILGGGKNITSINQSTLDQRQKNSPSNFNSSGLSQKLGNNTLIEHDRKHDFPMDPRTAVINFSKYLLEFEKTEIVDYDTIYWFNIHDRKASKKPLTTPDGVENNGFDNDKNEYIT